MKYNIKSPGPPDTLPQGQALSDTRHVPSHRQHGEQRFRTILDNEETGHQLHVHFTYTLRPYWSWHYSAVLICVVSWRMHTHTHAHTHAGCLFIVPLGLAVPPSTIGWFNLRANGTAAAHQLITALKCIYIVSVGVGLWWPNCPKGI